MASIQYKKNQVIATEGQSLSYLYLILRGSVSVSFPGGSYTLTKGDVIGICEAASDVHLFTYTAAEDTVTASYAYSGIDSLENLFPDNKDLAGLFCLSAFKQINHLLKQYNMMVFEYGTFYHSCREDYASYENFCKQNMFEPKPLPLLEEFGPLDAEQPIEDWLISYYSGVYQSLVSGGAAKIAQIPAVAVGLVGKTALDALTCTSACRDLLEYRQTYYQLYLNHSAEDLFALCTGLYFKLNPEHPDRQPLYSTISHIMLELLSGNYSNEELAQQRIREFHTKNNAQTPAQSSSGAEKDSGDAGTSYMSYLAGSLDTILTYSEIDTKLAVSFKEQIAAYKQLTDHASTEEPVSLLRRRITETFYTLYEAVFLKSLKDSDIPAPVRMFLYFGYVDEELAGEANLAPLYTLATSLEEDMRPGVYTLYHWLKAVYRGEKEPSRNQFDEDYTDHILSMKAAKKITDLQAKQLLQDRDQKLLYELKNMFPVVNKVSCGRISTYCPVFADHQVMKALKSCYVTPLAVTQAIEKIRTYDFSAFYRETLYSNEKAGIPKEFIHVECLPDVILMPNIGTRGVMWQEIEGKKRTTPARMMLSIFQLEDLNHILVRLTGEYRWEMCKRVQGARWNDISERSLTSEYFDYVQFYRKNHDLSTDAKEKIKTALQKARNNFKEMFLMDYTTWILHERSGSPRMNKVARQILFTYCPFNAETRQALSGNPIYKELSDRYDIMLKRRSHHVDTVIQKLRNSGNSVPEELENEKNFILM